MSDEKKKTFSFVHMRTWGHDFSIMRVSDGGQRVRVCLFTPQRPRDGDYVILPNKGQTTRYQVVGEVDTPVDPGDQHFCELVFAPRLVPVAVDPTTPEERNVDHA